MNIFSKLVQALTGDKTKEGPIPGAMGRILAQQGIYKIGPHVRKGTPVNVLMGCKEELVIVPGSDRPATRKDGTPIIGTAKGGKKYQVMDQYAIPKKRWKAMQNDQKRKAEGRWYSGEPQSSIDARKAKAA
ncbi:hypothetical protein FDH38_gp094 [Dinoroseobacter phage vB_DshS-R5C]|uniref:Uncharacterized protein n=1 Tax=Dinoroseobacter phage vB_DshS-R5C TaxID=1965368 RepID=A0A1V0DYE3_9CAUD|nr:hypothetical protein FDH38_gp094 [Dinoroseobacter phage vB_DshS-R5C]ARB06148.1 hypothetical protein vBDshSR5C_94 [Dinoroseobacter phage vB_DshS-R5C]